MEQSLTPIKDVLMQSGMKIGDIYAVELIGGATRVGFRRIGNRQAGWIVCPPVLNLKE